MRFCNQLTTGSGLAGPRRLAALVPTRFRLWSKGQASSLLNQRLTTAATEAGAQAQAAPGSAVIGDGMLALGIAPDASLDPAGLGVRFEPSGGDGGGGGSPSGTNGSTTSPSGPTIANSGSTDQPGPSLPPNVPGLPTPPQTDPNPDLGNIPNPDPGLGDTPSTGPVNPAATPELDSLVLIAFGLASYASYALTRHRAYRARKLGSDSESTE